MLLSHTRGRCSPVARRNHQAAQRSHKNISELSMPGAYAHITVVNDAQKRAEAAGLREDTLASLKFLQNHHGSPWRYPGVRKPRRPRDAVASNKSTCNIW